MEIWSDGKQTIVYDDTGLTFFAGEEVEEICSPAGDPVSLGARKGLHSSERRIFAVNPQAHTALVGNSGEVPYLFDLSRNTLPKRLTFSWGAAFHLSERNYLAILPEDDHLFVRFVELSSQGELTSEQEPEIQNFNEVEAGPILWEKIKQRCEPGDNKLLAKGPFAFQMNEHGFALADQGTGTVFLAQPNQKSFCLALRFPHSGDETLLPCPTAEGICVSGSIRENHSVLAFFDRQGTKTGEISTFNRALVNGGGMPFLAGASQILWPHSTNYGAVFFVDTKTLAISKETRVPGGSVFYDSIHHISPTEALLGSRSTVLRLSTGVDEEWQGVVVERKAIPKKIREQHTPVTGVPLLQLKPLNDSWQIALGQKSTLAFDLTNAGGQGTGVEIELSGDVIEKGLIQPIKSRFGGTNLAFEAAETTPKLIRLKQPEAVLPPGTEKGTKRTKIDPTHIKPFELELEGKAAGGGFLMVRVKTSGNVTSATGKAIRIS